MTATADRVWAACPARAALAGNPSDGHGGAVVATVVPAVGASVRVGASDRFVVDGVELDCDSLDDMEELVRSDIGSAQPLVPATLVALYRFVDVVIEPVAIDVVTTIPRSVGLAGSSAIVIAAIRAVIGHHRGAPWADRLAGSPSLVASVALAAERDVLGIAAGLQDRVVQAFDGTVAMEFGGSHRRVIDGLTAGSYQRLGPLPPGLFVAYRAATAGHSGAVHSAVDASDPAFVTAMEACAFEARRARAAIEAGDATELGAAMDATFELRASVMDLEPAHVAMVETARTHGAFANYTGSGGAIIVLPPDPRAAATTRSALIDDLECGILDLGSPGTNPGRLR